MAKGFPGMGGKNMNQMMKQMQKLQRDMEKMQDSLNEQEIESSVGGGVVKAVVNGQKQLLDIVIDPVAVDPEDVETLQDLVIAAVNQAMEKADKNAEKEMGKLTGGMNLPGMF